jgi:hypothetical protein
MQGGDFKRRRKELRRTRMSARCYEFSMSDVFVFLLSWHLCMEPALSPFIDKAIKLISSHELFL